MGPISRLLFVACFDSSPGTPSCLCALSLVEQSTLATGPSQWHISDLGCLYRRGNLYQCLALAGLLA